MGHSVVVGLYSCYS